MNKVDKLLERAVSLSHQGRFPEARMKYEKAIKILRKKNEFLQFFYDNIDPILGPNSDDIMECIKNDFNKR